MPARRPGIAKGSPLAKPAPGRGPGLDEAPRVLLLLPTTTYKARDFLEAAAELGVEAVVGSDQPQVLESIAPGRTLTLPLLDPRASTHVIEEFARFRPLQALMTRPEVVGRGDAEERRFILAEEYVPGPEVALEGLLTRGQLRVLAIFDKPDPLDGPFFEETLYVTPSRLSAATQEAIAATARAAARALGLLEGPVHAELRLGFEPRSGPDPGPWLLGMG